ncbi:MAG TPA: S8 family peptidase, partial [Kribbella sp.]
VIPSDVSSVVTAGKLDRRLFDVAGLIKDGYDDKSSGIIPLVVTYQGNGKGKANRVAPTGATTTRVLPVINGAAVRVNKKNAGGFFNGLSAQRSANGIDKIWLDARRHTTLDQSVPQIGAPAAWQAGYTGKGVTVAVLDTGIDASHPDLTGQVLGEKNFTTEAVTDLVGHGTHVASTIAGTAKASAGKYKGVAPDAKLYDGKVCEMFGCTESAILAGMEWAATTVKAKVVNISLGGEDTPEVDPLEAAVNRLTAQTGTLFVIAAGNSGPSAASVGSPGSADAALTVGAVDKKDELAFFSSRGPRVGDGAVKPDVTAPGVDIVAAKAKGSTIGDPVGSSYQRLSGTSMATPHVVGAAVLLAQQHPGWKASELKGALMGSAKSHPGLTAFEQGAGRIDLTKAIKQWVIAEPASVSFGTAQWPHNDDTPVTKDVTYRNLGNQPVTLTLAASLTAPGGAPAPADALKLSASTVTIPAGGTAKVQAVSNTKHDGPDGAYSGRITATGNGVAVVTPIGLDKEVESYNLTVNTLGPDGKPIAAGSLIFGLDSDLFKFIGDQTGSSHLRLPKGTYLVDTNIVVPKGNDAFDMAKIVRPELQLNQDTTVVMDFRTARPVTTTVPRKEAKVGLVDLGFDATNAAGTAGLSSSLLAFSFDGLASAQQGPALPPERLTGHVASQWGVPGKDGSFRNSPYTYSLANTLPGRFYDGFSRAAKNRELATLVASHNAQSDRLAEKFIFGQAPGTFGFWTMGFQWNLPSTAKHYLEAGQVTWASSFSEFVRDADGFPVELTALNSDPVGYQAGRTYRERWNAAAFVPTPVYAARLKGELAIVLNSHSDADGHAGWSATDTASSKLYRDGVAVAQSDYFGFVDALGLPAGKAAYKFVTSATRPSVSGFSTRTNLTWTFHSAASAEETQLPLQTVRYRPAVDSKNTAERVPVSVLPMELVNVPLATQSSDDTTVELQVSGDDGKTWRKAAVVPGEDDSYTAIFATPKGAKTVSLKAKVSGPDGSTVYQTVIGAYRLR